MPENKTSLGINNSHTSPASPKVLMLGWEFPPVINGGLGVACHDLCIALSKIANVTMIIPKSNPDFVVSRFIL